METTLTVHLPTVDIAITRRKLPGEDGDSVAIHMTAVPSVEAAARWFLQPDLVSLMSPLSMFAMWSMWMRAWLPWFPSTPAAPPAHPASRSETPLAGGSDSR